MLPPVARRQGELARRVTRCFELHGYEIVTLPVFEYAEVVERGWMDAVKFPKVQFVSSAVKALSGGRYEVTGKMTIKGITRDVSAPFTVKAQGNAQLFEGAFVLKRLEFKIGEGPWSDTDTVADEVQIRFKVLASAAPK